MITGWSSILQPLLMLKNIICQKIIIKAILTLYIYPKLFSNVSSRKRLRKDVTQILHLNIIGDDS